MVPKFKGINKRNQGADCKHVIVDEFKIVLYYINGFHSITPFVISEKRHCALHNVFFRYIMIEIGGKHMDKVVSIIVGFFGSVIAGFSGGWTYAFQFLLTLMAIDYVSGLVVAGVFKKSTKTKNGRLQSSYCWKGLARKMMTIVFVGIGYQVDVLLGTSYVKDGICIAFVTSELISIVENAGIMGVPIPAIIMNAIDILKEKSGGIKNEE